jgi:hypothetical protein
MPEVLGGNGENHASFTAQFYIRRPRKTKNEKAKDEKVNPLTSSKLPVLRPRDTVAG